MDGRYLSEAVMYRSVHHEGCKRGFCGCSHGKDPVVETKKMSLRELQLLVSVEQTWRTGRRLFQNPGRFATGEQMEFTGTYADSPASAASTPFASTKFAIVCSAGILRAYFHNVLSSAPHTFRISLGVGYSFLDVTLDDVPGLLQGPAREEQNLVHLKECFLKEDPSVRTTLQFLDGPTVEGLETLSNDIKSEVHRAYGSSTRETWESF